LELDDMDDGHFGGSVYLLGRFAMISRLKRVECREA
jgi:hypothetical protein